MGTAVTALGIQVKVAPQRHIPIVPLEGGLDQTSTNQLPIPGA